MIRVKSWNYLQWWFAIYAMWNENTSESNLACFSCVYFLNPLKARTMKTHKYFASFTLGFKYSRNTIGICFQPVRFAWQQSGFQDEWVGESCAINTKTSRRSLAVGSTWHVHFELHVGEPENVPTFLFMTNICSPKAFEKKSRRITSSAVKSDDQYI